MSAAGKEETQSEIGISSCQNITHHSALRTSHPRRATMAYRSAQKSRDRHCRYFQRNTESHLQWLK